MGVAYVNIGISKSLKEELAWAIDKQLWVVSNKMLFKNSYTTKKLKKTRRCASVINVGVAYVNIRISKSLKKEFERRAGLGYR